MCVCVSVAAVVCVVEPTSCRLYDVSVVCVFIVFLSLIEQCIKLKHHNVIYNLLNFFILFALLILQLQRAAG